MDDHDLLMSWTDYMHHTESNVWKRSREKLRASDAAMPARKILKNQQGWNVKNIVDVLGRHVSERKRDEFWANGRDGMVLFIHPDVSCDGSGLTTIYALD